MDLLRSTPAPRARLMPSPACSRRRSARRRFACNSVNPGIVETEGAHAAGFIGSEFEKGAVAQTPLGRVGQVDDIATVATFLASNDSKWITGELLRAGGGLS